jgi:muramidase (phage lysozyme)
MKQLYAQYVDAKRRQNESTAAVTYQSVARTLQESGERLRQKHGRAVDFEVAVKDGKTILRPILK